LLLRSFGAKVLPLEMLGAVERYLGWLTTATLMVSATSTAGEVMAVTIKGLLESATELTSDGLVPFAKAVKKLIRGS
jgi:hypothetical protein